MANLMISAEPDEMQSLRAVAAVEAAATGEEADLAGTAQALLREALTSKLAELGLRWNPSPEAVERHTSRAARPDGPVARLMKTDQARRYATVGLAVAVLILLWGGYVRGWAWTGFQGNNQLWDWLHLLLLPVAVGTLPLWIQHPEYLSRNWRMAYLAVGAAFAALVMAGYLVPLNWTGFPGNTLWNWLELTLLPIAVVSAPFLLALLRSLGENQKREIWLPSWQHSGYLPSSAVTHGTGLGPATRGTPFGTGLACSSCHCWFRRSCYRRRCGGSRQITPSTSHQGGTKAPRAAGNTATAR